MEDMNIEVVPPYMIASKVNIYILSVFAIHESNISNCLHFLMKTLKCHVILTAPLGGVTSTSANNTGMRTFRIDQDFLIEHWHIIYIMPVVFAEIYF